MTNAEAKDKAKPAKAEETDKEESSPLETFTAILLALVTVIGAVVAWRASVAADGAGDADFAGLRAAVNAEETRALNAVNAYEHYGAFTAYQRYNALGDLLAEAETTASDDELDVLESQRADMHDLALANQSLFPNKFLNRDGTQYFLQRELGELWADAAKEKDLNPGPQFVEADQLREKSNRLLLAVTILGLSLVFFTLVEPASARLQYVMLGLGGLAALVGIAVAVFVEFF